MTHPTEYDVVVEKSISACIKEVNKALAKGWVPQGGIAVAFAQGHSYFYQALVRRGTEPSPGAPPELPPAEAW